jgi:hypothetical protein
MAPGEVQLFRLSCVAPLSLTILNLDFHGSVTGSLNFADADSANFTSSWTPQQYGGRTILKFVCSLSPGDYLVSCIQTYNCPDM